MSFITQCVHCGEFVTIVATVVHAGWYTCPCCAELSLCIPETDLTPLSLDPFEIGILPTEEG